MVHAIQDELHPPQTRPHEIDVWSEDIHEYMDYSHISGSNWDIARPGHMRYGTEYGQESSSHREDAGRYFADSLLSWATLTRRRNTTGQAESLRQRLANADDYFRRKASEVLDDDLALRLLAVLYEATIVHTTEVDTCQHGIALAKLTAANFCEIGVDVIYITKSGQQFIDAIENS